MELRPDRVTGGPHDEFWNWCACEELRLQRCTSCGGINWPVTALCERCGRGEFDWERMSGAAKLVTWCTFERDYYRGLLPMPWDTILVELAEGPLFVSNPVGIAAESLSMDMSMRLVFIECRDSVGAFKLPAFTPAED